jgi:hypothetical protein
MDKMRRQAACPYSIKGILPHGPQKTLDGILQWLQLDLPPQARVSFYLLVEVLLRFCRSVILPYLVSSDAFLRSGVVMTTKLQDKVATNTQDSNHIIECSHALDCLDAFSGLLRRLVEVANETQVWMFY